MSDYYYLKGYNEGLEVGKNAREALRAENARLREALSGLNAAIDAFWNDKTRPSIAHMNDQTLLKVEAAQRAACAAVGETK